MPTPPTTYVLQTPAGLGFTWGCPTPETGFAVESIETDVQCDEFQQKNNVGEVIEIVTYNPRQEITVTGETTAAFTDVVGAPLTVNNLINIGGIANGLVISKSIKIMQNRTANQKVSITATRWPLILAV